jgi:ribosomal protein L32E
MSKVKSASEKKRLSYERDHYNRSGENNKSWRKAKPLKTEGTTCLSQSFQGPSQ